MTASRGQPPSPRNQTPGLMKNARKPWRLGEPWTTEFDSVEKWGGKRYLLSEGHKQRLSDSSTRKKTPIMGRILSKLSAETPIKHVWWDRVRKISGKNICLPKQYLNGKNGTAITNPEDIANEHAAVFTDNSSAHYSATFQAIKEPEEVKIDFTSDNTEVYNKPFRLRDLRRSIMKAKPRAPEPDGIHNNLLKHLPEDTLKLLKEILNKISISTDWPQQWRAATVIPIPNTIKTILTHSVTDPLLWPAVYAKSWSAWLIPASSGILKNMGY